MPTLPILTVCCVCKQVPQSVNPSSPWTAMSVYLERHHLKPAEVRLSHTYCPACYEKQATAWAFPQKDGQTTPRAA